MRSQSEGSVSSRALESDAALVQRCPEAPEYVVAA